MRFYDLIVWISFSNWKNVFITGTSNIKIFVLDEADEMLSRGFKDQIHDVFRTLGTEVQVSSVVNMFIFIVLR